MNPTRRRYLPWVAGIAVWTAMPVLLSAETAIWTSYRGQPVAWSELLPFRIADWYACGVFIPPLIWATRRWPVDRRHLVTRIPLHLVLLIAASAGKIALFQPLRALLGRPATTPFTQTLAGGIISELVAFAATAGAIHAIVFYLRYREREAHSAALEAQLTDAQLRALRAQLNPHFLFNTLNAVTALLHRDPARADAMLTRLGELLRLTLRSDPEHEIPLREELDLLDRYLGIMSMRFSDRVTVSRSIQPGVDRALVPSFVLQPIVENAFEHGVGKLAGAGTVSVSARADASRDEVVLTVSDDGPGPSSDGFDSGIGIRNTRHRLSQMYGAAGSLVMSAAPGGGTVVEMRLPFREASLA